MRLIIVSGSSGSGKSSALKVLEDLNFHCIDNLPSSMLQQLLTTAIHSNKSIEQMAISIDIRNLTFDFNNIEQHLGLDNQQGGTLLSSPNLNDWDVSVLYLDAHEEVLLKRFSAGKRKHPLTDNTTSLQEAIAKEKRLLRELSHLATLRIDTSLLSIHELKSLIQNRIGADTETGMSILFESFSYRSGVPLDADFVFDVRCLPNPHWVPELKPLTGRDQAIHSFFNQHQSPRNMINQLHDFLSFWLPTFIENNSRYLTIAIGCTGGQHRSVYIAEMLAQAFRKDFKGLLLRHRELGIEL